MQNLVRTGRTGHFLNSLEEHCLIGVKGDPPLGAPGVRRDCDVLVSELREVLAEAGGDLRRRAEALAGRSMPGAVR